MNNKQYTSGFTLIEMIVSLALFSVVITISVGALLTLIASNRQLQDEQAVLTNLSFALDSMTREIRTGTAYICDTRTNTNGNNIFNDGRDLNGLTNTLDCETARDRNSSSEDVRGISVIESGSSITGASDRIVYYYDQGEEALFRRIGSSGAAGNAQRITSDGVRIVDADFRVTGAAPRDSGDLTQPAVTIYLAAQVAGEENPRTYPIQTTVVQRTLDL